MLIINILNYHQTLSSNRIYREKKERKRVNKEGERRGEDKKYLF